jgi:hypothetical protein
MKRTLTLVTALLASLVSLHAAVAKPDRPNIILCMTDDQGWGDVSYNGLTKIKTPNIETEKDRVAPGGFPPGAPTDPNVRN